MHDRSRGMRALLAVVLAAQMLQLAYCYVELPPLTPFGPSDPPPVINWLLTPYRMGANGIPSSERDAWQKVGEHSCGRPISNGRRVHCNGPLRNSISKEKKVSQQV
jgi:hypothetical protein